MAEVITDVTPSKTADDLADALLQAKFEELETQVARLEAELNKPGGPARVAGGIKAFFGAIGRLLSKKQSPTARAIRTGFQGVIASLLGVLALTVVPYVQGVIVNYAAAHLPEIVTASGVSIAIISLLMNLVETGIQKLRQRFVSTDDASQA